MFSKNTQTQSLFFYTAARNTLQARVSTKTDLNILAKGIIKNFKKKIVATPFG
jgi:hypothetical protein